MIDDNFDNPVTSYLRAKKSQFKPGDHVTTSGYPGRIIRQYSEGMYEVRLASGDCCVPVEDIKLTGAAR